MYFFTQLFDVYNVSLRAEHQQHFTDRRGDVNISGNGVNGDGRGAEVKILFGVEEFDQLFQLVDGRVLFQVVVDGVEADEINGFLTQRFGFQVEGIDALLVLEALLVSRFGFTSQQEAIVGFVVGQASLLSSRKKLYFSTSCSRAPGLVTS